MTMRIGYVGLGHSHRSGYLDTLDQLSVAVTAAADPDDPDRYADEVDVPVYREPSTMFANESLDAVWVTLSNRDTPAVVRTAVDRGLDVFAEKSLGRTTADVEPLVGAVEDAGVTVGVGYIRRAMPVFEALRDRRRADWFGSIRAFEARFIKNTLRDRLASAGQPNYLYTSADARGGILQWLGCHYLDLVPWILDDPIVRVQARTDHGEPAADTEDAAIVQLETAGGTIGTLHCGYYLRSSASTVGDRAAGPVAPPLQLYGMDGQAVVTPDERAIRLGGVAAPAAPEGRVTFDPPDVPGYGGAAGLEYVRSFLAACRGDAPDRLATLADELRVLRVLDAAYESAETGRWVDVAGT